MNCARLLTTVALLSSCSLVADFVSDKTFLPHRDELSYNLINHVSNHHYREASRANSYGATVMATPFYTQSRGKDKLASFFGMRGMEQILVTQSDMQALNPDVSYNDEYPTYFLYSFNIDHSPNSSTALDRSHEQPMYGNLSLAPERRTYGTYLSIDKSLDSLLKGLRLQIHAPLVNVATRLGAEDVTGAQSDIPAGDGVSGRMLMDYFSGNHEKNAAHVTQSALKRGKIARSFQNYFGIADLDVRLDYRLWENKHLALNIGTALQIPTGTRPTNEYLFEPIAGSRGHAALGLNSGLSAHLVNNRTVSFDFETLLDWKYFFNATEKRLMTVIHTPSNTQCTAAPYRLGMQHKHSGVFPLANVLSVDHSVRPGHQVSLILNAALKWKNITFDCGYNLYWHQAEKVSLKTGNEWAADTYAFAHQRYSMYNQPLGKYIIGGTAIEDGNTVLYGFTTDEDDYNDVNSAIDKHKNLIGSYGDGTYNFAVLLDTGDIADGNVYPGAFTSFWGAIQPGGHTFSSLRAQLADDATGVSADSDGTLINFYQARVASTLPAQLTHSVFGGLSYKFEATYPVIVGCGGQIELQQQGMNHALEGLRFWLKVGTSF